MDRTLSLLVKFAALDRLTAPLRAIGKAGRDAGRDMAVTRREVLQLERSTAKIGAFRDLQRQVTGGHEALDKARRRVNELRAAIAQADGPTGALTRQLTAQQAKIERLSGATGKQVERLGRLGAELQDAGVDVRNLAREEDRLGEALGRSNRRLEEQAAIDRRAAQRDQRVARADAMGSRMQGTGLSMMAGGAIAAAPLIGAANAARDTASAMTDIAITAGMGADESARMSDNIMRLGAMVGQMPDKLRSGVGTLIASGLDVKTSMAMMPRIGRAATAAKAEVDDLARSSFAFYNNLKVPVADVGRALDVMTLAGKRGGVELKDMARSFPGLTAAAQGLGQTGVAAVADLSAALQIAKNGARDADEASNNLLNLLNKINSKETIGNFAKMGVDLPKAMKKAYAAGKTPIEAIIELTRQATKGDMAKLPFLFNDAQVQAALRPMMDGFDRYKALRAEALAKGGGTIDADFAVRMARDPAAQQTAGAAGLARASNMVGSTINPLLTTTRAKLGEAAAAFSDWADRSPAAAQALVLTAGAGAVMLTILGALTLALGVMMGPLARGWEGLRRFGTLLRTLGPGLARAGAWLMRIGGIVMRLGSVFRLLTSPIAMVGRLLLMALAPVAGALAAVTAPVWLIVAAFVALGAIAIGVGMFIMNNWRGIAAFFGSLFASFSAATAPLRASLGQLGGALMALGAAFLGWVGRVVGPFIAACASIGGAVLSVFQPAIDWIGRLVGPIAIKAWQSFGSIIGGVIGGIVNRLKGFVDFISGAVGSVTNFFNSANRPAPTRPSVRGAPAALPIAGKRARGGPVLGGRSYLIGEEGPEILEMPGSGNIVPNGELMRRRAMRPIAAGLAAGALAATPLAARTPLVVQPRTQPLAASGATAVPPRHNAAPAVMITGDITIEIKAQPGQDPAAIAAEVRRQLLDIARGQAAARASSYQDIDA